jgi:hypothetical protein
MNKDFQKLEDQLLETSAHTVTLLQYISCNESEAEFLSLHERHYKDEKLLGVVHICTVMEQHKKKQ